MQPVQVEQVSKADIDGHIAVDLRQQPEMARLALQPVPHPAQPVTANGDPAVGCLCALLAGLHGVDSSRSGFLVNNLLIIGWVVLQGNDRIESKS